MPAPRNPKKMIDQIKKVQDQANKVGAQVKKVGASVRQKIKDLKNLKESLTLLGLKRGATKEQILAAFVNASLRIAPKVGHKMDKMKLAKGRMMLIGLMRARNYLLQQLEHPKVVTVSSFAVVPAIPSAAVLNEKNKEPAAASMPFNFEAVKEAFKKLLGKLLGDDKFVPVKQTWRDEGKINHQVHQLSVMRSSSLPITLDEVFKQYRYTRTYENGITAVVTLNVSATVQTISLDARSPEAIKAGVELAKAAGWSCVNVPNNLSQDQLKSFQSECQKQGLEFSTFQPRSSLSSSNQQAPQSTQQQAPSNDKYDESRNAKNTNSTNNNIENSFKSNKNNFKSLDNDIHNTLDNAFKDTFNDNAWHKSTSSGSNTIMDGTPDGGYLTITASNGGSMRNTMTATGATINDTTFVFNNGKEGHKIEFVSEKDGNQTFKLNDKEVEVQKGSTITVSGKKENATTTITPPQNDESFSNTFR